MIDPDDWRGLNEMDGSSTEQPMSPSTRVVTTGQFGARPHGGRIQQARALFNGAPEPFVDLSTGINPLPYVVTSGIAQSFARLPEPEDESRLCEAAAQAYGVADAGCIVAAAGSQAVISMLPHILLPVDAASRARNFQADVAILAPTYGGHAQGWENAGASVVEVQTPAELENARTPVAVVCNPNNPDGRIIPSSRIVRLARKLAEQGRTLIVDEAFADFEGNSVASYASEAGMIVLRSFGKAYGLAGVRLGFAVCEPTFAQRLRNALGPWAVSGPAIAVGCAALADNVWFAEMRAQLGQQMSRLDDLLDQSGLHVVGGTRLFCLASHPHARDVYHHLGQMGILVRWFDRWPHWLRFGLPASEEAWQRLADALVNAPPLQERC